jgi:hypothetical protein
MPGVALLFGLTAASATTAADHAAPTPAMFVACDVVLNVDDPDPNGLNVRAAPNAKTGNVIGVLKPDGDWTEVHVVGNSGGWLKIDHAETIDDDAPDGERSVFKGEGWVHVSKLGISELYVGGGTVIRNRPAPDGAALLKLDTPDKEPKSTRVIGCNGHYIQIEFDGKTGWTRDWCTNERTTCS